MWPEFWLGLEPQALQVSLFDPKFPVSAGTDVPRWQLATKDETLHRLGIHLQPFGSLFDGHVGPGIDVRQEDTGDPYDSFGAEAQLQANGQGHAFWRGLLRARGGWF